MSRQDAKIFIGGLSWETTGERPGARRESCTASWSAAGQAPETPAWPGTWAAPGLPALQRSIIPWDHFFNYVWRINVSLPADEKLRCYFENFGAVQVRSRVRGGGGWGG